MGQLTEVFLASQGITPANPAVGLQPSDVEDREDA